MVEITVGLCESFKAIGIEISEPDLWKFEQALHDRGPPEPSGDASGSYMGTGSAHWNSNLSGQ